ncbi:MAG: sensor histidine kinase [Leucobacter sp.]
MTQSAHPPDTVRSPIAYAPKRIAQTMLHLAVLGSLGSAVAGLVLGAIGVGIGGIFVLGIGLVVLVGVVYALFGIAWVEVHRVAGLYELDTIPLRLQSRQHQGFGGYLRFIGKQSIDGRMWRALASFAVGILLGTLFLSLIRGILWLTVTLAAGIGARTGGILGDLREDTLVGGNFGWLILAVILGLVGCIAGMIGLAFASRAISVAIVSAGAREVELAEQARTSQTQREGAVRAADVERTRIERDLHDGVQPRLVSVGMTLGLAQQQIDTDPQSAKTLIAEAHTSTKAAITELRQLARGIHASVLDDRGLDAALSALAGRSHIPVQLDVRLTNRCSRTAEAAVYFALAESLTNAAKHSRASECRVVVRQREDAASGALLWARVEDNGVGGASVISGGGLDGITNRVVAAGGTIRIDSPPGGPTSVEVSVPCAF